MSDSGREDSAANIGAPELGAPNIGGPVKWGLLVIGLFFGGFIGWSSLAPLESAAVAPGTVSLDSSRKTVQHLEGGIVREIAIREGEVVSAGQALIRLDETQIMARLEFLRAQLLADRRQLELVAEEIATVRMLLAKGLTQKPRLLALQRREAELTGSYSRYRAQLHAAQDVRKRATIRAPMAGTVVGLQVHSKGGVIAKGEPLMYIVPRDEPLIVEAQIHPNDIDIVHPGLSAQIRLTSFNSRSVPPVDGRVLSVSADSMADRRTGQDYYLARIEIDDNATAALGGRTLYPGMPAEVLIVVGERTLLDYFLAPLTRSFNRAFREE
jgi:multidrug efflux pump subunit AcrA (membrane-fusion protein)